MGMRDAWIERKRNPLSADLLRQGPLPCARTDYTSAKAKDVGFYATKCNGLDAPPKGCVDFWGKPVADPKNCWCVHYGPDHRRRGWAERE